MKRYLETLLGNWIIALVPVVTLPLAAYFALKPAPTIQVVANIWVNESSSRQLSYADPNLPPAQNAAVGLGQLLQSPSYDERAARESPLYWQELVKSGGAQAIASDLARNAVVTPTGPDLVTITYVTRNAAAGVQMMRAILGNAPHEIERLDQQQASKVAPAYASQLRQSQARLSRAGQSLHSYMSRHHIRAEDLAMQSLGDPQLASLYQTVQAATVNEQAAAQQYSNVTTPAAAQGVFQVIDPPRARWTPPSKKQRLLNIAIGLGLGLFISGTYIVGRTALDRSLLYAEEVPELLGLPVLAVVPYAAQLAHPEHADGRA